MTRVFFFQAEDAIRDGHVTGVQTCALPISFSYIDKVDTTAYGGPLGVALPSVSVSQKEETVGTLLTLEIGRASCRERGYTSTDQVDIKENSESVRSTGRMSNIDAAKTDCRR